MKHSRSGSGSIEPAERSAESLAAASAEQGGGVSSPVSDLPEEPACPTGTSASRFSTGTVREIELGPLTLESGVVLPNVTAAYRHDGPSPTEAPQVLVVHALTGSADAAGDWWAPLIGPGRAIDTHHVGVLCANLLGSRYGSTGPTSINPATGQPYGPDFPFITTRDQARMQWLLADTLGIGSFVLVVGGSLGGMIGLEFVVERPERVRTIMPIAAPAATGALAMAWNHIQLELIDRLGVDGLSLARQLAMTTYRCETDFDERFGRRQEPNGELSMVSYLRYQGEKLVGRFDVDSYRTLTRAIDSHDIGRGRDGIHGAFERLARGGTYISGLGISGDLLFGPGQVRALVEWAAAAGVDGDYHELRTTKGHDAFFVEWPQLEALIGEILRGALAAG